MLNRRTLFAATAALTGAALPGFATPSPNRTAADGASPPPGPRGYDGYYERLPTVDLESRFDFIWGLQAWNTAVLSKAAGARQDDILKARGISPDAQMETEQAVKLFAEDPVVAAYLKVHLTAQQLKFAMLKAEFHADADATMAELDTASTKGPGRLELDPELKIPAYARHELHMQPGGYAGDDFAGYIYRYGVVGLESGHNFQDEVFARYAGGVPLPPDGKAKRYLEVGCGIGQLATGLKQRFPDAEVWAIDTSAPMLRYAHLRATQIGAGVLFSQRLGEDTKFPDNYFDVVTVNGVHHEIAPEASKAIISEVARVLRPGGIYFPMDFYTAEAPRTDAKGVFAAWWLHRWVHEDWKPDYTQLDLRREMRRAGLQDLDGPPLPGRQAPNMMGLKPT
jgi:ubiquinone/menaquinone biosynthesis C-methylase UbiE